MLIAGTPQDIDEFRRTRPRRPRQPRRCTVGYQHYPAREAHRGDDEVPYLRLSGLWLEALGFAVGSRVRITAEAGVVTLTVTQAE
ncbi:hypothetical protein WQ56_01895 [Luteimonas sp. FCS-9]|nr:hypothetical protein WQ56_01895 [Luteimonas sp. FCS-9]